MYNDIVDIYHEIFPLNQELLEFLGDFLPDSWGRVLDMGCGPGDIVGWMAAEGIHAVGIDSSEGMIAAAKTRHQGEYFPYSFSEINRLEGRFNLIYTVGNSLSYLPNDQLDHLMADVTGLLQNSGTLLVQVVNWDRFMGQGRIDFEVKSISGGRSFHRWYEPLQDGTVVFHTALKIGEQVLGQWSDLLYPKTRTFLQEAAAEVGMRVVGIYGDYGKAAFNPMESPALIVVAKRQPRALPPPR